MKLLGINGGRNTATCTHGDGQIRISWRVVHLDPYTVGELHGLG